MNNHEKITLLVVSFLIVTLTTVDCECPSQTYSDGGMTCPSITAQRVTRLDDGGPGISPNVWCCQWSRSACDSNTNTCSCSLSPDWDHGDVSDYIELRANLSGHGNSSDWALSSTPPCCLTSSPPPVAPRDQPFCLTVVTAPAPASLAVSFTLVSRHGQWKVVRPSEERDSPGGGELGDHSARGWAIDVTWDGTGPGLGAEGAPATAGGSVQVGLARRDRFYVRQGCCHDPDWPDKEGTASLIHSTDSGSTDTCKVWHGEHFGFSAIGAAMQETQAKAVLTSPVIRSTSPGTFMCVTFQYIFLNVDGLNLTVSMVDSKGRKVYPRWAVNHRSNDSGSKTGNLPDPLVGQLPLASTSDFTLTFYAERSKTHKESIVAVDKITFRGRGNRTACAFLPPDAQFHQLHDQDKDKVTVPVATIAGILGENVLVILVLVWVLIVWRKKKMSRIVCSEESHISVKTTSYRSACAAPASTQFLLPSGDMETRDIRDIKAVDMETRDPQAGLRMPQTKGDNSLTSEYSSQYDTLHEARREKGGNGLGSRTRSEVASLPAAAAPAIYGFSDKTEYDVIARHTQITVVDSLYDHLSTQSSGLKQHGV